MSVPAKFVLVAFSLAAFTTGFAAKVPTEHEVAKDTITGAILALNIGNKSFHQDVTGAVRPVLTGFETSDRAVGTCSGVTEADFSACINSCDSKSLQCSKTSGPNCIELTATCTLPTCCLTVKSVAGVKVVSFCYKGCCEAVDENSKIVTSQVSVCSASQTPTNGTSSPSTTSPPVTVVQTTTPPPVGTATPTPSAHQKKCFPPQATVELASGSYRRMDELVVGDRVRVAENTFSNVFMFTHKAKDVVAAFTVIHTAAGHSISATPGHYIYKNGVLAPAGSVKVGDELTLGNGSQTAVISVSETVETGIYNPQTVHGDIVVDGVVASTYTTALSPALGHAWLAPFRALYKVLGVTTAMMEAGSGNVADYFPSGSDSL